jgi:hypothetical protein
MLSRVDTSHLSNKCHPERNEVYAQVRSLFIHTFYTGIQKIVAIIRNICPVLNETYSFSEMIDTLTRFANISFSILDDDQTALGVGIYTEAACFVNHSCLPNAIVSFDSHGSIFLRANKPILLGQEIVISYLADMTREELQLGLETQYCFTCDCKLCQTV